MNFEELKPIILRVFVDEPLLKLEMNKSDVAGWDSIGHLNLILELEDEFLISFEKEEIEIIDSFESLLDLVNIKMNKK
jgi:acyl carrier protein